MRSIALTMFGLVLAAAPALAQQAAQPSEAMSSSDAGSGMGKLLTQGYEIRAAVPNGTRYIVFLQKDQSAYACEFVSLTKSRCGSIN
ncbi:hypothetical protein [Rhizobium herbae]|uniref:Opacity protein-like surface antigen n=1 Tax=Rhizobium herbae TaxID=508661 RepID=A0ABS4ESH5_9HYPH|nr:hypothetical protein [Rhizobium herbae]MBP1860887.1 opacity protein-like surface antigen [Rhizobium herbae]